MDFRTTSVADLAARVRARELSAREVTQAALDRIDALDSQFNAMVAVDGDRALAEAARIDERSAAGEDVGPLAGIPLGVKDLEDAAGFVTTHGSRLHAGDAPAATDSVLVARLRAAGCVVVGKTNTPEFGHKADTVNLVHGTTRNPWNPDRTAGGSSGGSGAAIAAGLLPLVTGSDGGGSIRIPSAAAGITGMKTSTGRVPSGGRRPPGWGDFSVKGPMARRATDIALALDAVVGPEPTDLRSLPAPTSPWLPAVLAATPPERVAWSPNLGYGRTDREVLAVCEAAVRVLEDLGAAVDDVEVWPDDPVGEWLAFTMTGARRDLDHPEAAELADPGLLALTRYAEHNVDALAVMGALDACHRRNLRLAELFANYDLILSPTIAGQWPVSGEHGTIDGEPDIEWVRYTYPFNMTRSPAGTVCAGFTADGMPVGLQVIGPQHGDVAVLGALRVLEDALAIDRVAPIG